jgi:hypothetical protein
MNITSDDDSTFDQLLGMQAQNRMARITDALVRAGYPATSRTRSTADNRRVGGAYFSQHLSQTAGDFAVSPARVPAFVERARLEGLRDVLNIHPEMNRPGHGPHYHLQIYRAGFAPRSLFKTAIPRPIPGVQIAETP